jgi:hypothetical protein
MGERLVVDPLSPTSLEVDEDDSSEAHDAFVLGSGRGGRKGMRAVTWEVVRSLRIPDDLPLLSQSLPAPKQNISQIRHSHHQLARLLATGTPQAECALITGYAPSYISVLKTDPTFQDLMYYYATQKEQIFVDVVERMKSLGLSTLDELQSRLEADPDAFANRELMELVELTMVKPMIASRGQPSHNLAGTGVQVNVNFVKANTDLAKPEPSSISVIDLDYKDIK